MVSQLLQSPCQIDFLKNKIVKSTGCHEDVEKAPDFLMGVWSFYGM